MMTVADLDALIDAVMVNQSTDPNTYFLVSPHTYQRLLYIYKRAHKRAWQHSQKERAQLRRRRREQKKAAAALYYQYRAHP